MVIEGVVIIPQFFICNDVSNIFLVGYKGYRSKDGSYYIKTFVKKMRELAPTHHLGVIMTRVNYSVATEFESKQMPTFDSCLTKDLYFKMNK